MKLCCRVDDVANEAFFLLNEVASELVHELAFDAANYCDVASDNSLIT